MEGGPSKINPPNSHPSNPIHKAAMAAQEPKPASKPDEVGEIEETVSEKNTAARDKQNRFRKKTQQHEINKTAVIISMFGLGALLFIALR